MTRVCVALLGMLLALVLVVVPPPAAAQKAPAEVVIGVTYPLSGPVAQVGIDCANAVKLAVEIINGKYDLNVPLAKTEGLPGLGGAKIRVVIVDNQGKPDVGQAEAERLITQEKVSALFGAYYSNVTATASQVAERYGVPYLNAESSSPTLTERGFKWFFRTSPHDGHFSLAMFDFMKELEKRRGVKIKTIGLMHEDTLFGADSAKVQEELAKKYGYEVVVKIPYRAKTTNLDAEVGKLKAANPDALLPTSYTSDAILFVKTAKNLDYNPRLLIAQDAGWTDPTFLTEMGRDAEGHITRAPFALDLAAKKPMIRQVNELFKKVKDNTTGRDISDVPARAFTGFLVLADAINRAKSTSPEEIRKALVATNMPPEQLIMPWTGVKFDEKGQNTGVRAILLQAQKGAYATVYPFELATADVIYPLPDWKDRK
jgi:branched-chain amino acid transport system substrate-binding protein